MIFEMNDFMHFIGMDFLTNLPGTGHQFLGRDGVVSGVPGGCLHQSHTCSCVAGERHGSKQTCGSRMKIYSAGYFQVRRLELREGGLFSES